jgi:hypothetical protein
MDSVIPINFAIRHIDQKQLHRRIFGYKLTMSARSTIPDAASGTSSPSVPSYDIEKASHESVHDNSEAVTDAEIAALGPAPDGGLTAWLNAFGGFCIFFCCLGFTSCFGVLQQYYSTHQLKDHSMDQIAWIGSLASFIQFAGGAIGGPMFDRYGAWVRILWFHETEIVLTGRIDDATRNTHLRLWIDDGLFVQRVLPILPCAVHPHGHQRGFSPIPCLCSNGPLLRQATRGCSWNCGVWVFRWRRHLSHCLVQTAQQLFPILWLVHSHRRFHHGSLHVVCLLHHQAACSASQDDHLHRRSMED